MLHFSPNSRFICSSTPKLGLAIRYGAVISVVLIFVTAHDKLFGVTLRSLTSQASTAPLSNYGAGGTTSATINYRNGRLPEESRRTFKILCYILLSRARVRTAMIIKDTWGSHCDHLMFFGGYEYPDLPVTALNITEGYENLWGKTKAALLHLANNPSYKEFQYFLKADDDTFVLVENLRRFIIKSKLSLEKPVWFGFKLKHRRMTRGYMSGGAGYVFNHAALQRVSTLLEKRGDVGNCNVDGEYGIEDLELGKCFLTAGVESVDTTDEQGRERFLPLAYEALLNGAVSSFHWIFSQAWNNIRMGDKCCSQDLISMHEVSPTQMKMMYHLLYKLRLPESPK